MPTETPAKETAPTSAQIGLLFELEASAFEGRRLLFDTYADALKEKDIELTPALFSRFLFRHPAVAGLTRLLVAVDKKKYSAEKLTAEIQDAYHQALRKKSVTLDPALAALIKDAQKQHLRIGALSALPDETVRELVARLKLEDAIQWQAHPGTDHAFPAADSWIKLAQSLGLPERQCVALTTCGISCRSALIAGMRCVVIPDRFSEHQDLGGADLVVESVKDVSLKDLLSLMRTCRLR